MIFTSPLSFPCFAPSLLSVRRVNRDDPPVWSWFKKNLPQYTVERAKASRARRPFKALSAGLHFLVQLEMRLLKAYGGDAV